MDIVYRTFPRKTGRSGNAHFKMKKCGGEVAQRERGHQLVTESDPRPQVKLKGEK